MAHLLKKESTLQREMMRYQSLLIGISLFMNVAAIFVLWFKDCSYSYAMRQALSLNEYYIQLETVDQSLLEYVSGGEEAEKEQLFLEMAQLKENMQTLLRLNVTEKFQRDVEDIAAMQEGAFTQIAEIEEEMSAIRSEFSAQAYGNILTQYETVSDYVQRIDAQFRQLHIQLLSFVSERFSYLIRMGNLYYAGFLLLLAALTMYGFSWGRYLNRRIVQPIQILTRAAQEIQSGKIFEQHPVKLAEQTYQEMIILVNTFNQMVRQIQEQIRTIEEDSRTKAALREKELENLQITNLLRTSELKSLQRQMNPHFLFNTLSMISRNAYLEGAEKTVFLLQKTAHLLRGSLDYMGKAVSVGQEIEMLGDYVYLQEQRFGKRISFRFDLDERFHFTHVPCMILQPLVENSIIHGVGASLQGGRIEIQTRYLETEKKGQLIVRDNGAGMSREALKALRESLQSDERQRERIGLANVYRRLTLFFQEAVAFEVEADPGQGMTVCITIPVEPDRAGGKEDACVDCR